MELAQVVGGNVARLRAEAGISLADLASAGGISKTTLHGIEQGLGNPTLSTMWALAAALRVSLGELLESQQPPVEVVRAGDNRPSVRGDGVDARLLHRIRVRGTVEVYDIEFTGARQESAPHLAGVEECVVLTEGRVTIGPVAASAELAAGDSIRFSGTSAHAYQGHDQRNRAVLLMIHPD